MDRDEEGAIPGLYRTRDKTADIPGKIHLAQRKSALVDSLGQYRGKCLIESKLAAPARTDCARIAHAMADIDRNHRQFTSLRGQRRPKAQNQ